METPNLDFEKIKDRVVSSKDIAEWLGKMFGNKPVIDVFTGNSLDIDSLIDRLRRSNEQYLVREGK